VVNCELKKTSRGGKGKTIVKEKNDKKNSSKREGKQTQEVIILTRVASSIVRIKRLRRGDGERRRGDISGREKRGEKKKVGTGRGCNK